MEIEKILEGKNDEVEKTDNLLDDTSASEPVEGDSEDKPVDNISNFPSPTEEQQADANFTEAPEAQPAEEPMDEVLAGEAKPVEEEKQESVLDEVVSDTAEPEQPVEENVGGEMHEENGVVEAPIKMFTQSQVDDIAGKTRLETREKTFRYIYDRYGVNSEEELDDLIGNAQRYDSLKEAYDADKLEFKHSREASDNELRDIKEKVALLESGIDKDRYEDAKFILKGKGLDVTIENIQNELATHPEWRKVEQAEKAHPEYVKVSEASIGQMPSEPVSKLSVLGNEPSNSGEIPNDEEEYALKKMFKV